MTTTDDSTRPSGTPQTQARLDFEAHAAGFARAMNHLDQAATRELDRAGIDPLVRELVRVRASQLNGCAYCVDMHTKDARAAGETEQRLYALPVWSETLFHAAGACRAGPHRGRDPDGGRACARCRLRRGRRAVLAR